MLDSCGCNNASASHLTDFGATTMAAPAAGGAGPVQTHDIVLRGEHNTVQCCIAPSTGGSTP